jgi:hypothetical protein
MIKRLIKIALLTGAAHVFTIITLKLLSQRISTTEISLVGELDSLFQLIINIIGFGLQLSAVRNIISSDNWKETYNQTQSARFTLSLLLMPLAILYLIHSPYTYLLFAPIFALSGDYALYGIGKPVSASVIAFCRVFIPSLVLVIFSLWLPSFIVIAYIISTLLVYWLTSLMISKWLNVSYLYKPVFKNLLLYINSINLGIVTLSTYFIGLGLLVIASNFYDNTTIAVAYLGLKLYMVFKGVLRIINQAFVKEMIDDEVCIRVDQLATFIGVVFAASFIIFPNSCIFIFYKKDFNQYVYFFQLIGVTGLISAMFTSLTTRSLLKFKDKWYGKVSAIAAIISAFLVVLLSYFFNNPLSIAASLLSGELIVVIGLLWCNNDLAIKNRFVFVIKSMSLLLFPVMIRIFIGDSYISLFVGMLTFSIAGIYLFYKNFSSIHPDKSKVISAF